MTKKTTKLKLVPKTSAQAEKEKALADEQLAAARKNAASLLSKTRWAKPEWQDWQGRRKVEGETRQQFFSRIAKQRKPGNYKGGRKPSTDRCPCGAMTRNRALRRNHKCSAGSAA